MSLSADTVNRLKFALTSQSAATEIQNEINNPIVDSGNAVQTAAGGVVMAVGQKVALVNKTVGAATQVTLPTTPTQWQLAIVGDAKGDAATNNITIVPDGTSATTIDGGANVLIKVGYGFVILLFNGTEWNTVVQDNWSGQNLNVPGLLFESATSGIIAFATGGQASATALTSEINRLTTVATAGDSVKLPAATAGLTLVVINKGAASAAVFPATGDAIDGQAANASVTQMPGSMVIYSCGAAGQWDSEGIATGYFGSFQTMTGANGIIAHPGGGQGAAVALTNMVNRVATCATAGDSVVLPATTGLPAGGSLTLVVINDGAASCNVFPATGDTINGGAANTAFAVPAGQVVCFTSTVAGQWQTDPAVIPLPIQWKQNTTVGATTAAVGDLTGAYECVVNITAVGAANYTTRTAAQMIADGALKIGQTYKVVIMNTNAGTTTLVGGTGVTITGTATIAQNVSRSYVVTVTGAAAMTFQEIYSGNA